MPSTRTWTTVPQRVRTMRFSLKEVILSVTLIALGLSIPACYVWILKSNIRIVKPGPLEIYMLFFNFLLLLSSGPLIGCGVFILFKKPMKGVLIGLLVELLGLIIFIFLLPHLLRGFGMGIG